MLDIKNTFIYAKLHINNEKQLDFLGFICIWACLFVQNKP